ncbi:L-ribulose-5-phosphate 4-epimerase [candidate division KSB1 bacterium]|nr:L-ribulose-5-phosphate 4-epimerase [candidate division KSB1 bacterium]
MSHYKELKEIAFEANMELPRRGVVIFTFGNVSAFDHKKGVFAIKPSGVAYDQLTANDMVIVDLDYKVVEGQLRPSSDTKTHAVLYRHFSKIGGICHTHSPYAVAWAQAQKPVPIFGTTHADHLAADIPCTQVMSDEMIRGDYEEETGRQIIQAFKHLSHEEIEMALVACHGPFTWGKDALKAVYNAVVLEELAKMAMWTLQINPRTPRLKKSLVDKHYWRKHGKNAYYGQPDHASQ